MKSVLGNIATWCPGLLVRGRRLTVEDRTVHQNDEKEWCISDGGGWLPGVYESELAAWYAFDFEYEVLGALQNSKNENAGGQGGVISLEDLVLLRVHEMLKEDDT